SIVLFFLEKTLQGCATIDAILHVDRNDDITILTSRLRFDNHKIAIADMIIDHRTAFDNQSVGVLALYQIAPCLNGLGGFCKDIERLTSSNSTYNGNASASCCFGQFNTTTFFGLASNKPFFLQHRQM